jgi:hypothetical protein
MTEMRHLIDIVTEATLTEAKAAPQLVPWPTKRLVETAAVLYHVTPARNLRAIQRDGLMPKRGARSKKLGEPVPAIYLFPSLEAVEDALSGWLGGEFDEDARLALLAVTVPPGAETRTTADYERIVTAPIPPENIRVLSRDALGEHSLSGLT